MQRLFKTLMKYYYHYSDVLDFNGSSHCETFFSMRLISNIIATGMISDDSDYSLETQRTMREDGCDQSVSLRER